MSKIKKPLSLAQQLQTLSEKNQIRLAEIISEISERSYRRGVQHGDILKEKTKSNIDPWYWRFFIPYKFSPDMEISSMSKTKMQQYARDHSELSCTRVQSEYQSLISELGMFSGFSAIRKKLESIRLKGRQKKET